MPRKDLSVSEKIKFFRKYDSTGMKSLTQRDAAAKLGIPQTTLSKLLRNRKQTESCVMKNSNVNRKRKREGKNVSVDEALLRWFQQAVLMDAPINRAILIEKAKQLAVKLEVDSFVPSNGWLSRWKERNNIVYKKLHGEKQDCDLQAAENYTEQVIPEILRNYPQDKIFNTDETGLYYRAMPEHCMVFKASLKSAGKKQKDRVTVLMTCNMSGTEKRRLLVVGKSKNPRCFRGVKNLPVIYKSNRNAWMTAQLFTNFIEEWDQELGMKKEKIALILDNCTAHPKLYPKNIEFFFLPANTTAITQPLDQGIIKAVKTLYRSEMRRKIINHIDDGEGTAGQISKKITLLDSIHMLKSAWENVSEITIANCFRKAGFRNEDFAPQENLEETILVDLNDLQFNEWVSIDSSLATTAVLTDEDIIQSVVMRTVTNEENDESESETENENATPPTAKAARDALCTLRKTVEQRGGNDEHYRLFYKYEKVVDHLIQSTSVQKTIDNFFTCDNA